MGFDNLMFNFSKNLIGLSEKVLKNCKEEFEKIDEIAEYNQQKVLNAFIETKICESHFSTTTGYGYCDGGREALDSLFSKTFVAEDSLVRHNFECATD
ncbi:hypothetical protein FACS189465_1480 [Clostridia bacterium]|nr:hypothetical protein FACS189465_1480 [Clostridia bacterium]